MNDDDLPEVETLNGAKSETLARLDFNRLWQLCGGEEAASDDFTKDMKSVMRSYRPGPDPLVRMPAKDKAKHYNALEKAVTNLGDQIKDMHAHIEWELNTAGIDFEPEDFFETCVGTPHEGLSYSEYLADVLLNELAQFSDIVREARALNKRRRGKPKQNSNLEATIRALGDVYKKQSGCEPMAGYRFNDIDESQPYQSPFLDFVQSALWTFNDAPKPSGYAIGEAARRAFELRK